MEQGTPILLFASMDIIGSTAFKRASPNWKVVLFDFFAKVQSFAEQTWRRHHLLIRQDDRFLHRYQEKFNDYPHKHANIPTVWKTNGDEVIFTVQILSHMDVIVACRCFSDLVFYYSEELRRTSLRHTDRARALSAKGTLWASSFHTNAFAIPLSQIIGRALPGGVLNEYIGISIDAGFRIGRYADINKVSISVELADELVCIMEILELDQIPAIYLKYDQGEPLKGLLQPNHPYPCIWFDLDHDRHLTAGHEKLIRRPLADRVDLRIAIDQLKAKFVDEFFDWPDRFVEFTPATPVDIADYDDNL